MKIVKLEAENIKRLRAIEIDPQGNLVILGGRNAQGKTSVLDSISAALGGEKLCPSVPIRKGEKSAFTKVTLDDLIITRTFTAGGSYLTVQSKDGATYRSPQAILDKLMGRLSFDPLQFMDDPPAKQAETLRQLCGLDFTKLDGDRLRVYEERRDFAREMKSKLAVVEQMVSWPDVTETDPLDISALTERVDSAEKWRKEGDDLALDLTNKQRKFADVTNDMQRLEREIEERKRALDDCTRELELRGPVISELEEMIETRTPPEGYIAPENLRAEIDAVIERNNKIKQNARKREAVREAAIMVERHDQMDEQIARIDDTKRAALATAKYPVDGLELGSDGVMFSGLPFEQASQAEQLKVSVAMGLALNSKLRVLLLRDGSRLDSDSLRALAEMAKAADAQVWIERVGDGDECQVIIEDGMVKAGADRGASADSQRPATQGMAGGA